VHVGLSGFSLEAVAREAGVAASLPRHYFGGTYELLKAATADVLKEVEHVLLSPGIGLTLSDRFSAYLDILEQAPWGHEVWTRAPDLHPTLDAIVKKARRRMAESIYGRPWRDLSKGERLDGRGRVGYIEAVIAQWIEQGMKERDLFIDALVRAGQDNRVVSVSRTVKNSRVGRGEISARSGLCPSAIGKPR
jgi:AcrR family transcriptional regulator